MSETVSKAHHEAVVRGLSATVRAQGEEIVLLRAQVDHALVLIATQKDLLREASK